MKALFNIKKLQFSKLTEGEGGVITYGTPIKIPGTVSLTMDVEQEVTQIYADGIVYIQSSGAQAVSGTLENYLIPKEALKEIYRYAESSNDEMMETDDMPYEFGMQFACDNEAGEEVLFTYYRVASTKPGINLQTKESGLTVNPQSVDLSASPIKVGDKNITRSYAEPGAANYNNYFQAISIPTLKQNI